jgi:hypothetical protein
MRSPSSDWEFLPTRKDAAEAIDKNEVELEPKRELAQRSDENKGQLSQEEKSIALFQEQRIDEAFQ